MLQVFTDKTALSTFAADLFVQTAKEAVARDGRFVVALTGGSSPVQLYHMLAEPPYLNEVPWARTYVFWGDERWVPLDDEKSNYKMSKEALLDKVPVPAEQIFPMWKAEVSPEAYAKEYEQILLELFGGFKPQFDLILLGMGDDGHTASLFPGTAVLTEQEKLVDAYWLAPQDMYRITLTATLINAARKIAFLTFGANKAKALYEVLEGAPDTNQYPSQLIRKDADTVHWLVDEAAAAQLQKR
ncbi:6-phosphogluconolactonase [Cnuella takakiae]|uniref:6-phosphogluconolactonase n=1 Tax=Cnuella takakiae TaxID=1302690 RepID=A0A1M5DUQ3_9BACT|nr:6-phosphogluconolactonase [Cnuella takakiae]OLY93860.1 6-phosphogluconolactonase [Cnuella takakiae]SHF70669.1 6-phosphogluconolactonase [Cnuella takakiae]